MRSSPGAPPRDPVVDAEAAVRLTRDLVRLRTVSDAGDGGVEEPAVGLLAELFTEFGWEYEVTEVAPGRPNLVAVVEGGGGDGPTLMFEGHTDVVTEGRVEDWSVDPYGGEIRDGRLWGRGSADMKSGLAAMIHGVRGLQLAGPFPGRIVLGVLCDEEGMMLGAKAFAASSLAAGVDGVVVCEPEGYEVCTSARGGIRLRLDLTGVMAHGAMPQEARSPLVAGARIVEALAEVEGWAVRRFGTHPHAGAVTVTPTVLHAGDPEQLNVIPAHGMVGVDVRTVPGTDHAELIARVRKAAADAAGTAGVTVATTVVDDRPAIEIGEDHPVVAALVAGHRAEHGSAPAFGAVPGTTDGTILTRDAGLPTVVYGPGGKWIAHQKDEYVEVAEIGEYARVYAAAARHFLTAGPRESEGAAR
ncbi:acetylornithine deacetylase [Streptomyces abyssalis]|uniref:Probable succinyl-diaminopimelate desuccinylase n=1 Tax=Streptomyces abyssalis TaxID=933944 RepID=A0A1E7JVP6_9ACTN|nr:M20 family metallopeptidase [Streptomyces abyssalis]OEU94513.1 acetylornithine deacetylase [Streptomyces abyssalis]OEU95896.1 acetylornithine deacetylase [Streptomyces abyssalis]